MGNELLDFYLKSHPVTIGVLAVLSIYFIVLNWTFIYRFLVLNSWSSKETTSLESLLMGASKLDDSSFLSKFVKTTSTVSKEILELGTFAATKESTKGLATLSVIASTSPFIGLFGTVVSILGTFKNISSSSSTMAVMAAGVSDALIATAAGIFVAIFAYTYHQILKRNAFNLNGLLKMQCDSLLAKGN